MEVFGKKVIVITNKRSERTRRVLFENNKRGRKKTATSPLRMKMCIATMSKSAI